MLHANKIFRSSIFALLTALLLMQSAVAQDDISVRQGDIEVFYNAFNTSFLSPEVASAVNVVRAKNRGLINISLIKHLANGKTQAMKATSIAGTSYNLVHREKLVFQEVVEPGARYYLAPFKINNDDELILIDISVVPEGSTESIKVAIKRNFFFN